MSLFRLDASIRTTGSHSRDLADVAEHQWRATRSDGSITRREIATDPLPADAWALAVSAAGVVPSQHVSPQRGAVALAAELTQELLRATAMVFAVPLYNFGVSQHFKAYVDLVMTDPRMAASPVPPTRGKPALLITVRGGPYGAGAPRAGWDHSTSWMRHVLEGAWRLDLLVLEIDVALVEADLARERCRRLTSTLAAWADGAPRVRGAVGGSPAADGGRQDPSTSRRRSRPLR